MHRSLRVLFAFAFAATLSASPQTWTEVEGGHKPTAAEVTVGEGPLVRIDGLLPDWTLAPDVDMFAVRIDDPDTFSCTVLAANPSADPALYMFHPDGRGISGCDDIAPGTTQARLTGQFVAAPGVVLIAVAQSYRTPKDWMFSDLWNVNQTVGEHAPDGPGAANAVFAWAAASPVFLDVPYSLVLTGASFARPTAAAEPEVAWGFVIPSALSSVPNWFEPVDATFQHTPTGLRIHAETDASGRMQVLIPGIAAPGNGVLHATAYNGNHTAIVRQWLPWGTWQSEYAASGQTTLRALVETRNAAGQLVSSPFTIHYRAGGADTEHAAYVWADQPTTASYTPAPTWSWNGNRPDPTITRSATGAYQVLLPGLGAYASAERGHVQVTPYNSLLQPDRLVRAKVGGWSAVGTDIVVQVRCFDGAGAPTDAMFSLSYHEQAAPIPGHLGSGAHVWANNATSASYTPSAQWTDSNGTLGPANAETVHRVSTGVYQVDLPDVAPNNSSIAMVTAYGLGSEYATVHGWSGAALPSGTRVTVDTFSAAGAPTDTRYDVLYLTNRPTGTVGINTVVDGPCGGPVLRASTRPVLGTNWQLDVTAVPQGSIFGFVSLGFTDPVLPLAASGAPECTLHTDLSTLVGFPLPSPVTGPEYELFLPNVTTFLGVDVHTQAGVWLPGVNALGIALSNGMRGTIGDV